MTSLILILTSLASGLALYVAIFAAVLAAVIVASALFRKENPSTVAEPVQAVDSATGLALVDSTSHEKKLPTAAVPVETILQPQINELLEKMPYDHFHHTELLPVGEKWSFNFAVNAIKARFSAHGLGETPQEAFRIAKETIQKQIDEWHEARSHHQVYLPSTLAGPRRAPTVMIVDDDVDVAMKLDMIFRQLGCKTVIVTNPDDLHRTLSLNETDLIVLDWMLNEHLVAGQVLERAVRVIDSFSDLRNRFIANQPKIITHSVLDRNQIALPLNGYFEHLDHWQKPISHHELKLRTSEIIKGDLYG